MTAFSLGRVRSRSRAAAKPIEYSLLLTATLCLLAFGVVMVFSASSTTSLLGTTGDSAYYLKRTLIFGALGLIAMKVLSGRGARAIKPITPLILALAMVGLVVVLLPGIGVTVNGAKRWIAAGPLQIQPSEIAKLALVLYGAKLLADRPTMVRSVRTLMPYLFVVAVACLLVVVEPDMGTAMIACFATAAMLLAAGVKMRHLAVIGAVVAAVVLVAIVIQPYRMQRLTGFVNPSSDPSSVGYQATQAKIALGSGGVFGVGLGQSLQKAYFLPEAHTDMIAAVIGEELGFAGLTVLIGLYGLFGYAGLRTAQRARDRYGKLLAAGITSLILIQALINLFAVMGLAPLTGVPLPFVSYGNSSLLVTLAGVGLLLGIARKPAASAAKPASTSQSRAARLRVLEGSAASRRAPTERTAASAKGRHSSRGNRGARRSGAGRRRRASR
jgi:cell division protein FtsW